ncbi:hypothetical protein C3B44_10480 [Corynebacterium yudongzhengii]|uniref:DUF4265 domain-containing protein n=1 Tax=Corynebacterium yudongzhengii TaxID=2080740 RepID=A0A2U1T4R6_9CORY|nr:DUF4265 domain-containing protein [Corynebacterium yudongzhengii]AWB83049.1 hypothetical protein C3B44_10480 [Corynebacterium yudongzhengii]PWC00965.1 DUF4265 domain-containing protein [Corynebacterium yudongzhengii]
MSPDRSPERITIRTRAHESASEELAALPAGGNAFVVDSIPFLDTTVALGDIVACVEVEGRLHVDKVLLRGGNSTLRIHAPEVDVVSPLLNLGLRVEQGPAGLVAVALGPDAPAHGLEEWLGGLVDQGLIRVAYGYQAQGGPAH